VVSLVLLIQSGSQKPAAVDPAAPITQSRSSAAEREARIREELERQQRELLEKGKEAATPTPSPAPPVP
jgi:hypothetical protein